VLDAQPTRSPIENQAISDGKGGKRVTRPAVICGRAGPRDHVKDAHASIWFPALRGCAAHPSLDSRFAANEGAQKQDFMLRGSVDLDEGVPSGHARE
jgi:hypothetical protein